MIMDEMVRLYNKEDLIELGHKLHQLKGAAGAVRISDHHKLVEKAEKLANNNDVVKAMNLISTLGKDPLFNRE